MVAVLFISNGSNAGNPVGLVGSDNDCNYNSIQAAFNDGADEIRVSNSYVYTDKFIVNRSVNIVGGFSDCLAAAINELDYDQNGNVIKTDWSGENITTVVKVNGSEISPVVFSLSNFDIQDGLNDNVNGPGGIMVLGYSTAILDNVVVKDNEGIYGGGIGVFGESSHLSLNNSRVINNIAAIGGGVYCHGGEEGNMVEHTITGSQISGNRALNGGGVALVSQCGLYHVSVQGINFGQGINFNASSGAGGGAYVVGNSTLKVSGFSKQKTYYAFNSSEESGGGIHLNNSTLLMNNAVIENNESEFMGGGISARNSTINVTKSEIAFNEANENVNGLSYGGAVSLLGITGPTSVFKQVKFHSNVAGTVPAIYVDGDGELLIESSVISNHITEGNNSSLLYFNNLLDEQSTNINFIQNTIADNGVASIFSYNGVATFRTKLQNNILDNNLAYLLNMPEETAPNSFVQFYFNGLSNNNLPNDPMRIESYASMTVNDFSFVDQDNGDYHLTSQSAMVDSAERPAYFSDPSILLVDFDGLLRGIDVANPNTYGSYDRGAYEYYGDGVNNDLIYTNGFE